MPIFEFECPDCEIVYEVLDLKSDPKLEKPCPKCKRMNSKIVSAPAVHLKDGGVGWAKDGYSRRHTMADGPGEKSGRTVVPVRTNLSIEPDKDNSKKKRPKLSVKK
jgi:putative FmdB family regulatory protein